MLWNVVLVLPGLSIKISYYVFDGVNIAGF